MDEGSGSPLILLHGNPTWSFFYRNLIKKLRGHFRVIAPDHMGHGLSDRPKDYPYTLSTHTSNLKALLKHLKLSKISLIVHDWGGPIGFDYATSHPSLIKSMVILNTVAFEDKNLPARIKFCRLPLLGELITRSPFGFAFWATKMAVRKKLPPLVSKGYLHPYNNYHSRRGHFRFVQDIPLRKDHPSFPVIKKMESNLHKLTCPKLIAWGGEDFCFHKHFFDRFLEFYPTAQHHYFKDAGHYLLEDAGETINEKIHLFLRRVL